jgi:hypothetical protein
MWSWRRSERENIGAGEIEAIVARAIEIDAQPSREVVVSRVREIAQELGVSAAAVAQALEERQAGIQEQRIAPDGRARFDGLMARALGAASLGVFAAMVDAGTRVGTQWFAVAGIATIFTLSMVDLARAKPASFWKTERKIGAMWLAFGVGVLFVEGLLQGNFRIWGDVMSTLTGCWAVIGAIHSALHLRKLPRMKAFVRAFTIDEAGRQA